MNNATQSRARRLLAVKRFATDHFTQTRWHELSFALGCPEVVNEHRRLFDSFRFGDDDYEECVTEVLQKMMAQGDDSLDEIESYIRSLGEEGTTKFQALTSDAYVISPTVFKKPTKTQESDLVAVMMAFKGNGDIYEAIKLACADSGLRAIRADEVWDDAVIHQDIFEIIHQSAIVVSDFTERNPNVYYETGIAHSLGREVVPIVQTITDVPSDFIHHRVLPYCRNAQGLDDLRVGLAKRLRTVASRLEASASVSVAVPHMPQVDIRLDGDPRALEHDQQLFRKLDALASESQIRNYLAQVSMNAGIHKEFFYPIIQFLKAVSLVENRFIDDGVQGALVEFQVTLGCVDDYVWDQFDHPPAGDDGRRDATLFLLPQIRSRLREIDRDSEEWREYERQMRPVQTLVDGANACFETYRTTIKKRLFI